MIVALSLSALLIAQAAPAPVPHPDIPCWTGQRTWTQPGERPSSTVVFDTRDEQPPYLITHNRDQLREGDAVVQNYNFIDYWFGEPAAPIRARFYLDERGKVGVIFPGSADGPLSLAQARERMPANVLCYLQRRFDRIEVLATEGYELLWSIRDER